MSGFGLVTPFDNVCFGHNMRKVAQYAINDDKISKDLMLVTVKFVQMSFQSYISWPKKLGLLTLFIFSIETSRNGKIYNNFLIFFQ